MGNESELTALHSGGTRVSEAALGFQTRVQRSASLLRFAIAAMWIFTGIVSGGLYPLDESHALLARTGITGQAATVALYGAAALDVAVGIATLLMRNRRWLWRAQLAIIAGYTVIITFFLPEQWLHPYGPVLKNLPLLAAIWLLHVIDDDRPDIRSDAR